MSQRQNGAVSMSERGALLTFALATAAISSIAAYAALVIATSQAQQGRVMRARPTARYAAEAALVVARERLWSNPAFTGTYPITLDTNADGVAETTVTITVTSLGPGGRSRIESRVTY